jgi:hypothetical protein
VIFDFVSSLSTTWRVVKLSQQLFAGECNGSIKDFDHCLTALANITFSLLLMTIMSDADADVTAVVRGACISLLSLLFKLVNHRAMLYKVSDVCMDINENRLSKFELALILTKVIETLTVEDSQYNFTQHFYSDDLLDLGAGQVPKGTVRFLEEHIIIHTHTHTHTHTRMYTYTYIRIYRFFPNISPLDDAEEDLDVDMPPLPLPLVQLFGHDSRGEWAGVPNPIVNQQVNVEKLLLELQQEQGKVQKLSLCTPLATRTASPIPTQRQAISLEQQLEMQRQNHEVLLREQSASLQMYPQQQQHHQGGGGGYIDSMSQEPNAYGSTFLTSSNASSVRAPQEMYPPPPPLLLQDQQQRYVKYMDPPPPMQQLSLSSRPPDEWVSDQDLGLAFRTSQPVARNPSLSMAPVSRANTQSSSWKQHHPYAGV